MNGFGIHTYKEGPLTIQTTVKGLITQVRILITQLMVLITLLITRGGPSLCGNYS